MKNLKVIGIALLLLLTASVVFANNNMYNQQMKYYNNMKTCTKGTYSLGQSSLNAGGKTFDIGMTYYIYGMQNNKCHIRELMGGMDMHCYLPMDVAKKYAEEGIYTLNASMKQGSAYSKYINQVSNDENYCKYSY